jgi:hypothetical protein
VALASDWVDKEGLYFKSGFWLEFTAHLMIVAAACLAGLAQARTAGIRLTPRPKGPAAWLVIFLGGVGSLALFVQSPANIEGWGKYSAPFVWEGVMALVVPVFAAVVAPRRFAVSLLLGWVGGSAGLFAYAFLTPDRGYFPFGLTLLALLVVAAPFARQRGETTAGSQARG